ncbi:MAG: AAA family ATPase, partial [SAR324 cluster bacterium]|nr:AAA family ATPase [SAR324 cluster bacterium]
MEGERRQATVLFSDLSGFTAMTEQLDPEEVQGLMRRLKNRAVEIVEAHGGIVSQFVGDEVLALFGIPSAHEDDPVRAVRAAQGLHDLAREMSPEVEDKIGRALAMHTGIDTGLVVTSTADDRDGRIGVTGDTVNTAARLKALAEEDRILLSPATARLVGDFFETEALESAELKGKAAPVTPHRVVGETLARTRFEAAQQRGFTPYVGRERELSQMRRCLENAIAGEGQYVTVVGEPGIGKSRLIYELRHEIDPDRVAVLEGRCQSYGAETPYLPFLDALRRGLELKEDDTPDQLLEKAIANIAAIDPELKRYLPHILHLLSISSEGHRLPET